MFRWKAIGKTSQVFAVLGIVLFCVPLVLTTAWGAYLSDTAYMALLAAQGLAGDMQTANMASALVQSPLYVGLLSVAGSYAPQAALIAGALGWGAAAIVILLALRTAGRPLAAIIASLLVVLNPLVLTTAGTETSWVLALGWATVALTVLPSKTAVWLKVILLILLLGLHFNAATILLALTLLAVDVYRGRVGWLPSILVGAAVLLWGLLGIMRFGSTGLPTADPLLWLRDGYAFFANQQLYWLYVPFVLVGLWDVWSSERSIANSQQSIANSQQPIVNGQWLGEEERAEGMQQMFVLLILWAGTAVLARDPLAPYIVAVTAVALAGLGAAWLARKLLTERNVSPERVTDERYAYLLVPLLVTIPLLLVSLVNLWTLYNMRPVQVQQVELQDQAATWLLDNSAPEATLYAPPRVGYASDRATLPALVDQIRDDNVGEVYGQLLALTPDYVVSENSFAWDYITRTTWFQDRYQARTQFSDGYAPDSPVTVWEYVPSPFDEGERKELTTVVNDRFALVGYQFEPQTIAPGDDVYLTLYLQAIEPHDLGFTTVVHLSAPDDGWVWAWREEWTPRSISGARWEPGQVIAERILIETTEDIPLGAYDLQVFWRAGDERNLAWPIMRDGDENVLDRIFLGYVIAPAPVDTSQAIPVDARFSDTIMLDSFAATLVEGPDPVPGEALQVDLFWDALSTPADDYTVFVHLLDGEGQIVASHDGMPGENRFPTKAWKPGQLVGDEHLLALPEDLAPGTYQVNVGLYLLETGERLPVWDADGIEQADRVLPLTTIEVGE